jgi:hypothetical protein
MRARVGTRTGFQPLNFRHSPANIANPGQSGTSTTQSEAQGVYIVHTPFFAHFTAPTTLLKRPPGRGAISPKNEERASGTGQAPNVHRTTGQPSCWKSTNIMVAGPSFPNVSWRNGQRPA